MFTPVDLRRMKAQKEDEATAIVKTAEKRGTRMTDEERTALDGLLAEADQLEADAVRLEKLEGFTGVAKPAGAPAGAPAHHQRRTEDKPEAIYCRWLRSGDQGAAAELRQINAADPEGFKANEYRASNDTTMNITTAADGGDLVPVGHYQGIIERLRPQAIHEQLGVTQIPGKGTTVNVPVDNEADSGAFVSTNESAPFDRDAPAVTKVAMTLVKYTKKVDLTYELLEDEDSALMSFLNGYVADGMAATLNSLLVTEVLANGTAGLTLDAASAIGAAEVPELFYKLKAQYARRPSVSWLMRFATEGTIRALSGDNWKFVDTPAGNMRPGSNGTIWGRSVFTDENMGAMQASGKSLLVGDFGYMGVRLAPGLQVLRDPYSRAGNGELLLHYYFRAVFKVLQAEAFQYATHPSA